MFYANGFSMNAQDTINYNRVAAAIDYIKEHFREQPSLDKVAEHVHLSSFHFQRLFSEWAGTSPKKFLQYISAEHAKRMLRERRATLFDTAYETGLSGTGRLHDLFIRIEGMTPAEYKHGGRRLAIHYSFAPTLFGDIIIASTTKGVCYMAFSDDEVQAFEALQRRYPHASFQCKTEPVHQHVLSVFSGEWDRPDQIKLHLCGTDFQIKVWETLLRIPAGRLSTYGDIARRIDSPRASRAVGAAVGSNPVAFLIPCHRVIQSSGVIGGYMWGSTRKTVMIGREAAQHNYE